LSFSLIYKSKESSEIFFPLDGITYVISDYCSKGSPFDTIHDFRFNFSLHFNISLALDIASGMNFLQSQNIIHGNLNSFCCLIDFRWTVSISSSFPRLLFFVNFLKCTLHFSIFPITYLNGPSKINQTTKRIQISMNYINREMLTTIFGLHQNCWDVQWTFLQPHPMYIATR
jgi:hypothetical protein